MSFIRAYAGLLKMQCLLCAQGFLDIIQEKVLFEPPSILADTYSFHYD